MEILIKFGNNLHRTMHGDIARVRAAAVGRLPLASPGCPLDDVAVAVTASSLLRRRCSLLVSHLSGCCSTPSTLLRRCRSSGAALRDTDAAVATSLYPPLPDPRCCCTLQRCCLGVFPRSGNRPQRAPTRIATVAASPQPPALLSRGSPLCNS